jgi:hypothetical protein
VPKVAIECFGGIKIRVRFIASTIEKGSFMALFYFIGLDPCHVMWYCVIGTKQCR